MTSRHEPAADLARRLRGRVILPGEPDYDEGRRTFNAMLDRRPRLIARPLDTADVSAAVTWAAEHDLPISIRGGGHSVAGYAVGPDAMMLDLRELRGVTVDPGARVAVTQGGALLDDLDRATTAFGLAAPSGTYFDTGVGGLTLTGGIGYILAIAGFACDVVVGAELVRADGVIVDVDAESDAELLWALRGGGGNFGVVTAFRQSLVPIATAFGGELIVEGPGGVDALRLIFEMQGEGAPDELTVQCTVAGDEEGHLVVDVVGLWVGDPALGPAAFEPLRVLPGITRDTIGPTTYAAMQTIFERMGSSYRHYWKSKFVRDVGWDLQAAILDAAERGVADSVVLVEPIHGLAHRLPDSHAAFGARRALANVSALAVWSDPEDDDGAIAWARDTTAALEPYSLRGGGYLNYAPEDEPAKRVELAFGQASFRRLQAVKARLDPENRFRFNANIPPA